METATLVFDVLSGKVMPEDVAPALSSQADRDAFRKLLHVFMSVILPSQTPSSEIASVLSEHVGYSPEVSSQIADLYAAQAASIAAAARDPREGVVQQEGPVEWRLGVSSSSSELKSFGALFLQVKIGGRWVEMTLPQMYSLLSALESV
jgi:hypothetical protein